MGDAEEEVEADEVAPNPTFESWLALHAFREKDSISILKASLPETVAAGPPTTEYLFLLSSAYRRALARGRSRLEAVRQADQREGAGGLRMLSLKERHEAEAWLINLCWDLIYLLEKKVLPSFDGVGEEPDAQVAEAKVFATTMKADFLRYLMEFQRAAPERKILAAAEAKATFKEALQLVEKFALPANSATRLRAVANYMAMLGEDSKSLKEALAGLEEALAEWEQLDRREQERAMLLGNVPSKKSQTEGDEAAEESSAAESLAWPPGEDDMERVRSAMMERASELRDLISNA